MQDVARVPYFQPTGFQPKTSHCYFTSHCLLVHWVATGVAPRRRHRSLSACGGSTRRQAAVDSKFKLFFPKGGKPGEDVKAGPEGRKGCTGFGVPHLSGRGELFGPCTEVEVVVDWSNLSLAEASEALRCNVLSMKRLGHDYARLTIGTHTRNHHASICSWV